MRFLFALIAAVACIANSAQALDEPLALPTDNDALFRGDGPGFYQVIERDYHGEKSTPWEGGQYGFVRDPVQTSAGIVYTRFHEGIDIRPLHRDEQGEPLDQVRAIASGTVVYTNLVPGYSNYGKYAVVEHHWNGSSYFSLYGHLNAVQVHVHDQLQRGDRIGVMGYTGVGINQARAHVHLELNLMLSRRFENWYNHFHHNDPNHHGLYNGINLQGIDIARFYLAQRENPALTVPEFLEKEETFYKLIIPRSGYFELPRLYPWMLHGKANQRTQSWEVSFNRAGVPLKIEPSDKSVREPELSYAKPSAVDYNLLTRDVVTGRGRNARLSDSGKILMRLFIYPD